MEVLFFISDVTISSSFNIACLKGIYWVEMLFPKAGIQGRINLTTSRQNQGISRFMTHRWEKDAGNPEHNPRTTACKVGEHG